MGPGPIQQTKASHGLDRRLTARNGGNQAAYQDLVPLLQKKDLMAFVARSVCRNVSIVALD